MNKIYSTILILLVLISCSKDIPISDDQANMFIKFFGDSFIDIGYDVKQTSDNGYVLTGTITNTDRGKADDKDLVFVKTDKFGNELNWSPKRFGGALNDWGNCIQTTSDNGYIIIGTTTDSTSAGYNTDIYLVKLNSVGDSLWTKTYGGTLNDEGRYVSETNDGGYILTGFIGDATRGKDIVLIKTDINGIIDWQKVPGGGNNDDIGEYVIEIENGFLVAGISSGSGIILKTASRGGPAGAILLGDGNETYCKAIVRNSQDKYVYAGTTISQSGEKSVFVGEIDNIDDLSSATFNIISLEGEFETGDMEVFDDEIIITGTRQITTDKDIFLLSSDLDGNVNFTEFYGAIGDQEAFGLDVAGNGGYIITGANLVEENSLITLVKTRSQE